VLLAEAGQDREPATRLGRGEIRRHPGVATTQPARRTAWHAASPAGRPLHRALDVARGSVVGNSSETVEPDAFTPVPLEDPVAAKHLSTDEA